MAKPANVGRWGDISAPIVEPISGKKDVGWAPTERPPAQYLNWLFNIDYQWRAWLDTIVAPGATQEGLDITTAGVLGATGKHGDRKLFLGTFAIQTEVNDAPAAVTRLHTTGYSVASLGSTDNFQASRAVDGLRVGDRIRSIVLGGGGAETANWVFDLIRVASNGTVTVVATRTTDMPTVIPASGTIDHTVLEDFAYFIRITKPNPAGSPSTLTVRYIEVTYDRPAP